MRYGSEHLKLLAADTKSGAITRLRELVCGKMNAGRRRRLANTLFDLLDSAVDKGAGKNVFMSHPLNRETAARGIDTDVESKSTQTLNQKRSGAPSVSSRACSLPVVRTIAI